MTSQSIVYQNTSLGLLFQIIPDYYQYFPSLPPSSSLLLVYTAVGLLIPNPTPRPQFSPMYRPIWFFSPLWSGL